MRKRMPHSRDPHPVLAARKRRLAKIRGAVERQFAVLKERYHGRRVRYRGLFKHHLQLPLICFAMNLKRADWLRGAACLRDRWSSASVHARSPHAEPPQREITNC